jgi:NACalpha-BTF3-like transcription factor
MADEKETQAQFDLQVQINKVLQDRQGLLKAQEKALSNQVQLAVDLCKALKCEQLDDIEKRLGGVQEELKKAAEEASRMGDDLETAAERGVSGSSRLSGALKKASEHVNATTGAAAGLGAGIVTAFSAGFQTLMNFGSGIVGVLSSFGRLGKAIFALPFRLLEGLFSVAQATGGGVSPIRLELENIRKEFGSLATNEGKAGASSLAQFRAQASNLAGTGLTLRRVFGMGREGVAKAMAYNTELMKALGPAVGNFNAVIEKSAVELAMYRKGLGLTAEQQAQMMKLAQAAGKDPVDAMRELASGAINMGAQFGINAKLISGDVAQMRQDFGNFGTLSTKELLQTSVYARKLGIEVKSLTGLISAFDNFEDAAQNAAKLSQSMGMNIDTMKMMNAQNPAERLSLLQKAFRETGKSVDAMNRQELKLLATQAGISEETAKIAFSQRGLSMSYDQVQKAGSKSEKKQLSQVEVMKKLADSIERVFGSGGGTQFKSFFDAFSEGFARGIIKSKEFMAVSRAIRRSLKEVYWGGVAIGRMFVSLFPGIKEMMSGLKSLFDPARFRVLMSGLMDVFRIFFTDIQTDPKAGVKNFIKNFKTVFQDFFSSGGDGVNSILEGGKTFLTTIGKIFTALLPIAVDGLVALFNKISEFITNPPQLETNFGELFGKLAEAAGSMLSALWQKISPSLIKMFKTLFEKSLPVIKTVGAVLLSAVIGKMILTAVTGALIGAAVGGVGKMIGGFFTKAFSGTDATRAASDSGRALGSSMAGGLTGFVEGLGDFFKAFAKIGAKDVLTAALKLVLISMIFMPAVYVFAIAIAAIASLFTLETALTAAIAMTAIAVAAVSIKFAVDALSTLKPSVIGPAMLGAVLAGVFIFTGALVLAVALRAISVLFTGIDWMGVGIGLLGMAVATAGIVAMMYAASLLTPAVLGTAIVGLATAAIFMGVLLFLLPYIKQFGDEVSSNKIDPEPYTSLATIMMSMAAMAISSALMIVAGPLGISGLGYAMLFMMALNNSFLPQLTQSASGLEEFDALSAAGSFALLAVTMLSLDALALASAVMIVAGPLGIAGLGYAMLFMIAINEGFIPVLDNFFSTTSGVSYEQIAKKMTHLAVVATATAVIAGSIMEAGVVSIPAMIAIPLVSRFFKNATKILLPSMTRFVSQLMPMLRSLSSLDADAGELRSRIQLILDIVNSISGMSSIAKQFGNIDKTPFESHVGPTLESATSFFDSVFENVTDLIRTLTETTLDENQIKSAASMGNIIGAVGNLIKNLRPDPATLSSLKSKSLFGESSASPEQIKAISDSMKDTIGVIKDNIVPLFGSIRTAASQIGDAETMGPKVKIIADSFNVLGSFANVISTVTKTLGGEKGTTTEKIAALKETVEGINKALFSGDNSAFREAFNGISILIASIQDPAALEPKIKIVADLFSVLGSFASSIAEVSKLMPPAGEGKKALTNSQRLKELTNTVSTITDALMGDGGTGGALTETFNKLKSLIDSLPTIGGKAFMQKVQAVSEIFGVLGKFSTSMKDIISTTAGSGSGGAADASKLGGVLGSINQGLFNGPGGGALMVIVNALNRVVSADSVKSLVSNRRNITQLGDTFKVLGEMASSLSSISTANITTNSSNIKSALDVFATLPEEITGRITTAKNSFNELSALMARAGSDPGLATVIQMSNALSGDGRVTVEHENVQINVNIIVQMSAEQIARGILSVNNTTDLPTERFSTTTSTT